MKEFFQLEIKRLDVLRGFAWEQPDRYADFLAQTYYYVCHTTRLLAVCASRLDVKREKLHQRFLKHAAEERSHHLLAARDIEALGKSLASYPERPLTSALYEAQYFKAEHVSPTAVFGYILALEGVAVTYGPYIYEAVAHHHGDGAASFVRLHAKEDPDHLESAFEELDKFTAMEVSLVRNNFLFTTDIYRKLVADMAMDTVE
jgi:thiaminase